MAGKPKDRIGQRYGKLVVEYLSGRRNPRSGGVYWWCRCACGNIREVSADSLSYSNRKKKVVTECLACARRLQAPSKDRLADAEQHRRNQAVAARGNLKGTIPNEWLEPPLTVTHARELRLSLIHTRPCRRRERCKSSGAH